MPQPGDALARWCPNQVMPQPGDALARWYPNQVMPQLHLLGACRLGKVALAETLIRLRPSLGLQQNLSPSPKLSSIKNHKTNTQRQGH